MNHGEKNNNTPAPDRPCAYLNAIYENEEEWEESEDAQCSNSSLTKSNNSSSEENNPNSSKNNKSQTKHVTESSVKPPAIIMANTATATVAVAPTATIMKATTTTTITSRQGTTATSASTASAATTMKTAAATATTNSSINQKIKPQKKPAFFLYNNNTYDNPALNVGDEFNTTATNKEILLQNASKSPTVNKSNIAKPKDLTNFSTITSPKDPKYTKTVSSSNNKSTSTTNKSIYSIASKVPMSYNISNGLTISHHKSSSFSSSSSSPSVSPSLLKPTSDYSTSSSLSHSSSAPNLSLSSASSTRDSTSISSKSSSSKSQDDLWLSKVESNLKSMTSNKTHVTSEQLKHALQVKESFVSDRFVQLFDKDTDGQIEVEELMEELRALINGTQTDKLRFLFNVYNMRGNGHIMRTDLRKFFTSSIEECKLDISDDNIQALTNAFFQAADRNRDGKITFDEMHSMLQKRPSIAENIDIRPAGGHTTDDITIRRRFRYFSKTYIQNNLKKVVTLILFVFINLGLMGIALYLYWDKNAWVKVARANGMALNFNCTLVLVLMLRRTLTWLRNTPLRNVLPFDHHIYFHMLCGYLIALLTVGHVIGHIGNSVVTADNTKGTALEQLFTTKAGVGWVADSAYITGNILFVVLFIMVALSLPVIRQSGLFEVFYWSHKLYLVFWAVLIIHAPNFWMWFLVPGTVFIIELIARQPCVSAFYMGKTYIEKVALLPSDVTQLVISRPAGFTFKSGDYVFIQIPAVAKYEWHPFTISSAPENMEEIWLHIRTAGHWTRSLHQYLTNYTNTDPEIGSDPTNNNDYFRSFTKRRASSIAWLKTKPLKARKINSTIRKRVVTKFVKLQVHIDGPYGTASRHIFEEEHAVLIGSGIGITPFASILQSIVSRYKASCVKCPGCSHRWCHGTPASFMNLKKVDFVWIIRDQRHFEWFTSLLCRLEREQEVEGGLGGILDIHIYMTSVPPKTDMRGMGLQLALDLVHEDEKTDLLTGLRTRTQAGRPDFDKLFSNIKNKSEGRRVKVFFCGSPLLGTTLKIYSHKYDFRFAHEYF